MLMLIYVAHPKDFNRKDFNTSHVNVNLALFVLSVVISKNFNTSHVNVNHT